MVKWHTHTSKTLRMNGSMTLSHQQTSQNEWLHNTLMPTNLSEWLHDILIPGNLLEWSNDKLIPANLSEWMVTWYTHTRKPLRMVTCFHICQLSWNEIVKMCLKSFFFSLIKSDADIWHCNLSYKDKHSRTWLWCNCFWQEFLYTFEINYWMLWTMSRVGCEWLQDWWS